MNKIEVRSQDLGVAEGEGEESGKSVVEKEGVEVGLDEVATDGAEQFQELCRVQTNGGGVVGGDGFEDTH